MENTWRKDCTILTSLCDAQGLLGVKNSFDLFMDMAAEHAAKLGVSYYDMLERRCYWVAVRTKVRFHARPRLGDTVSLETWPGRPGLAKSDRFYTMRRGEELLVEGRTEWAAQDIDTGAVRRTDSYGWPMALALREDQACPESFRRFRPLGGGAREASYTVGSQDIDVGRHMNNVAYVRMLLGVFSTEELAAMDIAGAELSYRRACLEGERLVLRYERRAGEILFDVYRPDGELAAQAAFELRQGGTICSRS